MERFVEQAEECGLSNDELAFAKLAVELARRETPRDVAESFALWERIVAHGTISHCPMGPSATLLASLVWQEGHSVLVRPREHRKSGRNELGYTIVTKPW